MASTKTGAGVLALAMAAAIAAAQPVTAAESAAELQDVDFSFEGPFGVYDKAQLQRGYRIYAEVCSSCHGLNYVSFRNLGEEGGPGFSEEAVKVLAEEFPRQVSDGPNESGEMFDRPGKPSDRLPDPFPNESAARAANGGSYPPDLSVIAKARAGGPDYIYSLLVGYEDPPADVEMRPGQYYNAYFPGHAIGMPPIMSDGMVAYDDGTPETLEQHAKDISAFLMWAAEPKLEARRRLGFGVMVFLLVFASLLYFSYQKVWRDVEH